MVCEKRMVMFLLFPLFIVLGWLWLWGFLNAMNHLHCPSEGFRYDILLRQYVKKSDGTKEYI